MPSVRSLVSKRRTRVVAVILLLSKIMPTYSRYILKGLVYIAIAALSSRQPFFYTKCTKLNIRLSYNIRSVSEAKYIFLTRLLIYKVYNFFI